MPENDCYLGWDVGGWEGSKDGLAALQWSKPGQLQLLAAPTKTRLKPQIAAGELTFERMLALCADTASADRPVLGIDAPLGWPAEFTRLVADEPADPPFYLPAENGEINNHLAYRISDRIVYQLSGKKPMSAVFDRLGNNATKAVTACRLLLANNDNTILATGRMPVAQHVIIEVYPALWKRHASKASRLNNKAAQALTNCDLPPAGSDERDAVLAALTAACYDNQARGLQRNLPALYTADEHTAPSDRDDLASVIASECWTYFPKSAMTRERGNAHAAEITREQ